MALTRGGRRAGCFLVVVAPFRSCGRAGDGLGTHLDPLGSSRQSVRNRSGNLDWCSGVLGSNLVSLASVEMTGSQARRATGKSSRGAPEAPTPIREAASAKLARRRADRLRNRQKLAFGVRPAGNGSSKTTPHRSRGTSSRALWMAACRSGLTCRNPSRRATALTCARDSIRPLFLSSNFAAARISMPGRAATFRIDLDSAERSRIGVSSRCASVIQKSSSRRICPAVPAWRSASSVAVAMRPPVRALPNAADTRRATSST